MGRWAATRADRDVVIGEIEPFLPDRIFDAHAHLVRHDYFADGDAPELLQGTPRTLGIADYLSYMEWLHPGRRVVGGLFSGLAFDGQLQDNNEFVAAEVAIARAGGFAAFSQLVATPTDDLVTVESALSAGGFAGLKLTVSDDEDPRLPEPLLDLASGMRLVVTVYLARRRRAGDPPSWPAIRDSCSAHPEVRFVLAHLGRGLEPWCTIDELRPLLGLPNLWFDSSAVTETDAVESVLAEFGPTRVMYGTDFPTSHLRGSRVSTGDAHRWMYEPQAHGDPAEELIGVTTLRALLDAARRLRLSEAELDGVFHGNAAQLLGPPA